MLLLAVLFDVVSCYMRCCVIVICCDICFDVLCLCVTFCFMLFYVMLCCVVVLC